MPDVSQRKILDASTINGNGTATDVRNLTALSAFAQGVGGTSADLSFQATNDPAGVSGWAAIAHRNAGGGAYATTAVSITAGLFRNFFFDPTDNIQHIRTVVANQVGGVAITVTLNGEQ